MARDFANQSTTNQQSVPRTSTRIQLYDIRVHSPLSWGWRGHSAAPRLENLTPIYSFDAATMDDTLNFLVRFVDVTLLFWSREKWPSSAPNRKWNNENKTKEEKEKRETINWREPQSKLVLCENEMRSGLRTAKEIRTSKAHPILSALGWYSESREPTWPLMGCSKEQLFHSSKSASAQCSRSQYSRF